MSSSDRARQEAALSESIRDVKGAPVLPARTTLTFDSSTARRVDGAFMVEADTSGALTGRWDVLLVPEGGSWRIASASEHTGG